MIGSKEIGGNVKHGFYLSIMIISYVKIFNKIELFSFIIKKSMFQGMKLERIVHLLS